MNSQLIFRLLDVRLAGTLSYHNTTYSPVLLVAYTGQLNIIKTLLTMYIKMHLRPKKKKTPVFPLTCRKKLRSVGRKICLFFV